MTCRHRKLVFVQEGMVIACPQCGREWLAYLRNGMGPDYSVMRSVGNGDIRLDPQNEVRGE